MSEHEREAREIVETVYAGHDTIACKDDLKKAIAAALSAARLRGWAAGRVTPNELLLDCWNQWAYDDHKGGKWAGGLSTLEDLEVYLRDAGLIAENGAILPPASGMPGEAPEPGKPKCATCNGTGIVGVMVERIEYDEDGEGRPFGELEQGPCPSCAGGSK